METGLKLACAGPKVASLSGTPVDPTSPLIGDTPSCRLNHTKMLLRVDLNWTTGQANGVEAKKSPLTDDPGR